MRIGYARVSTEDQNSTLQTDALTKVGRERLFQDQLSGTPADRPSIREARSYLREGDNLVVWKLDRLGRGVKGLVDLVAVSAVRKGHLLSPTDQIDTLMATGRFSFRIMASLAHLERELIVERTQAGLGAARRPCRIGGQKHLVTTSKVEVACRLLASGSTSKEIVKNLGISVPIRYRWVPMPLALLLYHNTNSLSMLAIDS